MTVDYLSNEFIRRDCGVHGAEFSDEDCQKIREEVLLLHEKGEFNYAGVYWIANRLVADGVIQPKLSRNNSNF